MYNEKVKEQFISQVSNDSKRKLAIYIFDAFEPYEETWGADLCTRSSEDLRAVLSEIRKGVRSKSRARNINILKEYVSWCIDNNIENACDGMLHVKADDSAILLEKMISGPYHLTRFIRRCPKKRRGTFFGAMRGLRLSESRSQRLLKSEGTM